MANEVYITAGISPNDTAEANGTNTVYITAGIAPDDTAGAPPASEDVFFENRYNIEMGMKPLTAAGMGGVLIE